MHDAFGRELKVGDRVMVPMVVKSITATADFCNVDCETVATMPPEHRYRPNFANLNTLMLLRANPGDDLEYRIEGKGPARIVPFKRHFKYVDVPPSTERTP